MTAETDVELVPMVANKPCGECYACCIHLGVVELHKHGGQTCKHLTGAGAADKRCGIYAQRPNACAKYVCLYAAGLMPYRPDVCGILCTPYQDSINLIVFDEALAGRIDDTKSKLAEILGLLVEGTKCTPGQEIRVVFARKRKILIFRNGLVFGGEVFGQSSGEYEALTFTVNEPHIGKYRTREVERNE